MTPIEHYRDAERLLQRADDEGPSLHREQQRLLLDAAQVHATLATAHMTAGVWGVMQATVDEASARTLLAHHLRALASAEDVTDWPRYIRQVADGHDDGTSYLQLDVTP